MFVSSPGGAGSPCANTQASPQRLTIKVTQNTQKHISKGVYLCGKIPFRVTEIFNWCDLINKCAVMNTVTHKALDMCTWRTEICAQSLEGADGRLKDVLLNSG